MGYFDSIVNRISIAHLTSEKINEIKFLVPSLDEQTAIATYLDEKTAQIDTLIEKKQKLIELLKEERKAIINEAVSGEGKNWERKKLKYVAKLRDEILDNCKLKIAVENIESGTGRLVNMDDEKRYDGSLSAFKKGDTIFNKLRPYLHKVYLAQQDGGVFGELLVISPSSEILPEFLFYKLFSSEFVHIIDGSTQGTKMPRANWNDFICHQIIQYPKKQDDQRKIVEMISSEVARIDPMISKAQREIELMQEYKTTLISEVVTGKIKVV